MAEIFISHSTEDSELADAVYALLKRTFEADVNINQSSKIGAGPAPGTRWFDWIRDKLKERPISLVLLTPESAPKLWLAYEAGAAEMAATALDVEATVIPLRFWLEQSAFPQHLQPRASVRGDGEQEVLGFLSSIRELIGSPTQDDLLQRAELAVPAYLQAVEALRAKLTRAELFDRFHSVDGAESIEGDWFAWWTTYEDGNEVKWEIDSNIRAEGGASRVRFTGHAIDEEKDLTYVMEGVVSAESRVALSYWAPIKSGMQALGVVLMELKGGKILRGTWQGFTSRSEYTELELKTGRVIMSRRGELPPDFRDVFPDEADRTIVRA